MNRRWKLDKRLVLAALLLLTSCTKKESVPPPAAEASLEGVTGSPNRVVIDQATTTTIVRREVTPIVSATGMVTIDPRSVRTVSSRYDGRIERLYVRYNFQPVNAGDRIMDIYSPQMLAEEKRLIALSAGGSEQSALVTASKERLRNLGLTDEQIENVSAWGMPINPLPVYSPFGGHIHDVVSRSSASSPTASPDGMSSMGLPGGTSAAPPASNYATNLASSELSTKEGSYVKTGQALVAVYDASQVWVILNIARSDASLVQQGDAVIIRSESDREHAISAKIDYIEPMLDPAASSLRARVYLTGMSHHSSLKIGALVDATITSHPANGAWLPRTAVVRLGKRDVVFVQRDGRFAAADVQTGLRTDALVQILSGIDDTTRVALQAHYFVDSDSFIRAEAGR